MKVLILSKNIWNSKKGIVKDVYLEVEDGYIKKIGKITNKPNKSKYDNVYDFTHFNSLLIPSLINAHTHIELSNMKGKIKFKTDFIRWIKDVIKLRKKISEYQILKSIDRGLNEVSKTGTDLVITHFNMFVFKNFKAIFKLLNQKKITIYLLIEVLGFGNENNKKVKKLIREVIKEYNKAKRSKKFMVKLGLAPHAPYSTSRDLYEYCIKLSKRYNLLLSSHLAEDDNESDFVCKGDGKLVDLLKYRGLYDKSIKPTGMSPVEYLKDIGFLDTKSLIIHLNYISDNDCKILKKSKALPIICPKSYAYFKRGTRPALKLYKHKIPMAIGTDSLASNDSLSIIDEMVSMSKIYPSIKKEDILKMATSTIARYLGLDIGDILPEYKAKFLLYDAKKSRNLINFIFKKEAMPVFLDYTLK